MQQVGEGFSATVILGDCGEFAENLRRVQQPVNNFTVTPWDVRGFREVEELSDNNNLAGLTRQIVI